MEALLPYLPQLIAFAIRLGIDVMEMFKTMTDEEIQKYLDKVYDDIAVKKRLRRNAEGKLEWTQ
ncbi:MAG TPA: hypothetical protein ACFYD6_00485 [Candidatus Brocadiia bacterium]|nr:hypothetical protein [Candidatus Brocadiales bacterium]